MPVLLTPFPTPFHAIDPFAHEAPVTQRQSFTAATMDITHAP